MTAPNLLKPIYEEGTLWIMKWKSRITGRTGQGPFEMTKQEAQELADKMNEEIPEIEHWIEEAY